MAGHQLQWPSNGDDNRSRIEHVSLPDLLYQLNQLQYDMYQSDNLPRCHRFLRDHGVAASRSLPSRRGRTPNVSLFRNPKTKRGFSHRKSPLLSTPLAASVEVLLLHGSVSSRRFSTISSTRSATRTANPDRSKLVAIPAGLSSSIMSSLAMSRIIARLR